MDSLSVVFSNFFWVDRLVPRVTPVSMAMKNGWRFVQKKKETEVDGSDYLIKKPYCKPVQESTWLLVSQKKKKLTSETGLNQISNSSEVFERSYFLESLNLAKCS